MLRAGVSLPPLMKLLGHADPEMTMRYVESCQPICNANSTWPAHNPGIWRRDPRSAAPASLATGLDGVIEAFRTAQHALEMYRRTLSDGNARPWLDRLSNRLTKIVTEIRNLQTPDKRAEIGH